MKIDERRLSKIVAHALRHEPWLYELELDESGWTPITNLLEGLHAHGRSWQASTEADLAQMVAGQDKQRYEILNGRIRALYGHSTTAKIRKEMAVPPPILYHGTAEKTAKLILSNGLKPMNRQYVHLSTDTDMAAQVGQRKDKEPVILQVLAGEAHQQGIVFYKGNERVWLADFVPPRFITGSGK